MCGTDRGRGDYGRDLGRSLATSQAARGDVYGHGELISGRELLLPSGELLYRGRANRAADLVDEPGLLGGSDERRRGDDAAVGVFPANEGFESDDPLRCEFDDGLVIHDDLVEAR